MLKADQWHLNFRAEHQPPQYQAWLVARILTQPTAPGLSRFDMP
jgi:hypothetical protein